MDSKKISFGFTKITKKSNILTKKPPDEADNKIELIKCVEGKEIKLVDEKVSSSSKPLVIPLIGSSKTSAALASLQKRKSILEGTTVSSNEIGDNQGELKNDEIAKQSIDVDTIEKRAAREILNEITENSILNLENNDLTLPIKSPDELPLEGATESTIDDYQTVPIEDFGKAMLRGMGWKEVISKVKTEDINDGPVLRPKGMGLGADKAIKRHVPIIPPDKNEVLEIKKKAFVRIIGGKHKDFYGQIEGFDDYSTRIIIRFALGGHTDAIHEFMVQPVSKKEYQQCSKVINSAKYDKYKKLESENQTVAENRVKLDLNNIKVKNESEIKKEETEIHKIENKNNILNTKIKQHNSDESTNEAEEQISRSRSRDHKMHKYRHSSSSLDSNKSKESSPPRRHQKNKKKSSKTKKNKKSKYSSSSENEKRHKKKTKTRKRSRSRSKHRKR